MRRKRWWSAVDNLHLVGVGISIALVLLLISISLGIPETAFFFVKIVAVVFVLLDVYNLAMYFVRKNKGVPVLSEEDSIAILQRYVREHSATKDLEERELVLAIQTVLNRGNANTVIVQSEIASYEGILEQEKKEKNDNAHE